MSPLDLGIVLLSALLHAGWSIAIKGSRDALAFNLLQVVATAPVALAMLWWVGPSQVPRETWLLLAATGVAHSLYFYWLSRSYTLADISLVYPIARSTPALLPLLAVPLLGESISLIGGVGIATVVAGMWMVSFRGDLRWRAFLEGGIRFAYLTLAATVAYSLLDKSAMATLSGITWVSSIPRAVFFYFMINLACCGLFVPLALLRLEPGSLRATAAAEWRQVALAACIGLGGYSLILDALRRAPASYVVAVRQSSVLFVLILSVIWLGERPGPARVVGAVSTVLGVALIALAR
jgi:drug/metabolite transporter (DMT)-like permease